MSATATQHPVIPPRPSRSTEKPAMPVIPPRPSKNRSVSPNPDRFAPSPLNDPSPFSHKSPRSSLLGVESIGEPIERSTSVDLPSVGQEGIEYDNIASERSRSNSPEQTRTVGADVKLHAPKPSLPAASAKQRVMAVTRTDSDKAASYGIGKPSSTDGLSGPPYGSTKKKASTTSQLSNGENPNDEEHGIPEIGRQVPMYPNAGDVQAPSPAPQQDGKKHHARKTSARGTLPPGSYGLHGHGVAPQDKLEKAYFEKHPDLLKKEHTPHHHDRANDFSMSSDELNKIVRDTARSTGLDTNYAGTPGEHIGWQALEESTSRVASPMPVPIDPKSPVKATFRPGSLDKDVIHVDEPNSRRRSVMFNEDGNLESDDGYRAPILADDEVEKNPPAYEQPAAVELERRGSQSDEAVSRPTSRPASLYKEVSFEHQSTPLEDVEEYEPLFPEDEKADAKKDPKVDEIKSEHKQRFPSQDIWEDAPSSLHYTAEVSTPDLPEQREAAEGQPRVSPPPRSGETPAQAFARQQEELAEKEATERGVDGFLPGHIKHRPLWAQQQQNPASGTSISRPSMTQRFPSRDVWEDTPDSLKLETTVSAPDDTEEGAPVDTKPDIPQRPQRKQASEPSSATSDSQKPSIPERPKPKQTSNDDGSRPVVPDRPKPQIPNRPVKAGPTSGGLEPADAAAPPRQKPAVPSRPMGSKIAALQAGFMSDLNNRLRLGPQGPKKEEPAAEEAPVEEKEKAPLSDARKGRARGPQRRAPAKSPSPAAAAAEEEVKAAPAFSFSIPTIVFEIDPEEGDLSVADLSIPEPTEVKEEKAVGSSAAVSVAVDGPSEKKELSVDEVKPIATNTAGEPVLEVVSGKEEDVKPTEAE